MSFQILYDDIQYSTTKHGVLKAHVQGNQSTAYDSVYLNYEFHLYTVWTVVRAVTGRRKPRKADSRWSESSQDTTNLVCDHDLAYLTYRHMFIWHAITDEHEVRRPAFLPRLRGSRWRVISKAVAWQFNSKVSRSEWHIRPWYIFETYSLFILS